MSIDDLIKSLEKQGYSIEERVIKDDDFITVKFRGKEDEIRLKRLVTAINHEKNMQFQPNDVRYPDEFQPLTGIEMSCRGEQVKCECGWTTFWFDAHDQSFYCERCSSIVSVLDIITGEATE